MSPAPIRVGHPDAPTPGDTCGCCEGTALSTVRPIRNRPALSAVAYRVGDHPSFKASMLASLASSARGPLAGLGTRDDDDFSIALIDAWAAACEVLSFYQERHANEAFVGTARERLSIGEIARLIGYRLHPGAAAETDLAFLMDDPPGAEPSVADLEIEPGTRVQSQPGPGELAQVFETREPLTAKVAWNRLRPRQNQPIAPANGDTGAWLAGQATGLAAGDAVLIVGSERLDDPDSAVWDFRRVVRVTPDPALDRTRVRWDHPLDSVATVTPEDLRLYHLRDQAALFGYNAPHPLVLSEEARDGFGYVDDPTSGSAASPSRILGSDSDPGDWQFVVDVLGRTLALDTVHKGFVAGGWAVLTLPTGVTQPYLIGAAEADGLTAYGLSGKVTLLALDTEAGLAAATSAYRRAAIFGDSVELAFADTPLLGRVEGSEIDLDARVDGLPEARRMIVAGRRAQATVAAATITLEAEDGATRTLSRGTRLTLTAPPQPVAGDPGTLLWWLAEADGFAGTVEAPETDLTPVRADATAGVATEVAVLDHVDPVDALHSRLMLTAALAYAYDRADLAIHANVARASHGEGTTEILGGGDPSRPNQSFRLKQNPVTQRFAATESGVASTLEVRIDGVRWDELPDLYDRDPKARVFATALTDAGETVIRFGDGISGARPPAGRDNIVADYSKGLGSAGNVRAGQLVLPLDRPLGLKDVTNPLPASGGADPEPADEARRNAPIYTLTLGRVVSITDYRDFALGYPGIAKADARWIWDGETRRIVVTVAGAGGTALPPDGPTLPALLDAYREFGDPFVQFDLISYAPTAFRLALKVAVDPAYDQPAVLADVDAALRAGFAFETRGFAQAVALSKIAAVAHAVPGVLAVDIDRLYRDVPPQDTAILHQLLVAQTGRLGPGGGLLPAEILTLSADPLDALEVMP